MIELLREICDTPWKPIARGVAIAWLVFFGLFMIYAARNSGEFLVIDNVNLVIHEGGHLLFSWLGETMTLWGGTLLQWLVPLLLAGWFWTQRHTTGFAFCLFFFFENWLYTATYMADARAQVLPLVAVGIGEVDSGEMHDFFRIFTQLGVLEHDTEIAAVVRFLGWTGMLACVVWFGINTFGRKEANVHP